jgi:topoisomerase-4 subunit B
VHDLLEFYMGKNTQDRQLFIIDNLRQEEALEAAEMAEVA